MWCHLPRPLRAKPSSTSNCVVWRVPSNCVVWRVPSNRVVWCIPLNHVIWRAPSSTSEVQSKIIFMGHQILSFHVSVVRSFFIFWGTPCNHLKIFHMIIFQYIVVSPSSIPKSDLVLTHNSSCYDPISTSPVPKSYIIMPHNSSWFDPISTSPVSKSHIVMSHNSSCQDSERICPSGGSISRIWSRFGVGVRSFPWNWSVRNGGVLGESSTYFREASRRLSTRREWDWHLPDACWHVTARNMPQEFGFHSLLWFIPHFPLTLD